VAYKSQLQAVIFDLDDTLYPERQYMRSGLRRTAEMLCLFSGRSDEQARRYADWMWRQFQAGRRGDLFDAMLRRFRLPVTQFNVKCMVGWYRQHRPAIRSYPGTKRMLAELRASGLKLGLLSDGYLPAQPYKLEVLKLAGCFDAVVLTEELGREFWKPSPRGFRLISRRLKVPGRACAYVADNPAKDFVAPNELGWLTIQWRRPGQLHADNPAAPGGRPQVVVRSERELWVGLIGS
jgi:putative hydrolase of the HAD superfamily